MSPSNSTPKNTTIAQLHGTPRKAAANSGLEAKQKAQKPPFYPQRRDDPNASSRQVKPASITDQPNPTGHADPRSPTRQLPSSRQPGNAAQTWAQRRVDEAITAKGLADYEAAVAKRNADDARYRAQTTRIERGGKVWDRRFARVSRNTKVAMLGFVASARLFAGRLPVVGPALTFLGIGLAVSAHRSHRQVKGLTKNIRDLDPKMRRTVQTTSDLEAELLRAHAKLVRASGRALAEIQKANMDASQAPTAPVTGSVPAMSPKGPHSG